MFRRRQIHNFLFFSLVSFLDLRIKSISLWRINIRHRDHPCPLGALIQLGYQMWGRGPVLTFHVPGGHYSDLHLLVLTQLSHLHSPLSPTIPWSSPASSDRSYTVSAQCRGKKKIDHNSGLQTCQFWRKIRHLSAADSQVTFLNLHKPHAYQTLQIA